MDARKITAIGLVAVAVLGLGYGAFSYASEWHSADVATYLSVAVQRRIEVPIWVGAGSVVFLLIARRRI